MIDIREIPEASAAKFYCIEGKEVRAVQKMQKHKKYFEKVKKKEKSPDTNFYRLQQTQEIFFFKNNHINVL